jgi:YHS domain-containing protein
LSRKVPGGTAAGRMFSVSWEGGSAMRKRISFWNLLGGVCLGLAALLVACGGGETKPEESAGDAQPAGEATAEGPSLAANLAAADGVDGEVDHVIARCASCALHMDGKEEFASDLEGYTLYFCREGCKDRFEKDKEGMIVALEVPQEEK